MDEPKFQVVRRKKSVQAFLSYNLTPNLRRHRQMSRPRSNSKIGPSAPDLQNIATAALRVLQEQPPQWVKVRRLFGTGC